MNVKSINISKLDTDQRASFFGEQHKNIKDVETWFDVKCRQQGTEISVDGAADNVESAVGCLNSFMQQAQDGSLTDRKASEALMMYTFIHG